MALGCWVDPAEASGASCGHPGASHSRCCWKPARRGEDQVQRARGTEMRSEGARGSEFVGHLAGHCVDGDRSPLRAPSRGCPELTAGRAGPARAAPSRQAAGGKDGDNLVFLSGCQSKSCPCGMGGR